MEYKKRKVDIDIVFCSKCKEFTYGPKTCAFCNSKLHSYASSEKKVFGSKDANKNFYPKYPYDVLYKPVKLISSKPSEGPKRLRWKKVECECSICTDKVSIFRAKVMNNLKCYKNTSKNITELNFFKLKKKSNMELFGPPQYHISIGESSDMEMSNESSDEEKPDDKIIKEENMEVDKNETNTCSKTNFESAESDMMQNVSEFSLMSKDVSKLDCDSPEEKLYNQYEKHASLNNMNNDSSKNLNSVIECNKAFEKNSSESAQEIPMNSDNESSIINNMSLSEKLDLTTNSNATYQNLIIQEKFPSENQKMNSVKSYFLPCINIFSQMIFARDNDGVPIHFDSKGIFLQLPTTETSSETFDVLLSNSDVENIHLVCDKDSWYVISITISSKLKEFLKENLKVFEESSDEQFSRQHQITLTFQDKIVDIITFLCSIYGEEKITKNEQESTFDVVTRPKSLECECSTCRRNINILTQDDITHDAKTQFVVVSDNNTSENIAQTIIGSIKNEVTDAEMLCANNTDENLHPELNEDKNKNLINEKFNKPLDEDKPDTEIEEAKELENNMQIGSKNELSTVNNENEVKIDEVNKNNINITNCNNNETTESYLLKTQNEKYQQIDNDNSNKSSKTTNGNENKNSTSGLSPINTESTESDISHNIKELPLINKNKKAAENENNDANTPIEAKNGSSETGLLQNTRDLSLETNKNEKTIENGNNDDQIDKGNTNAFSKDENETDEYDTLPNTSEFPLINENLSLIESNDIFQKDENEGSDESLINKETLINRDDDPSISKTMFVDEKQDISVNDSVPNRKLNVHEELLSVKQETNSFQNDKMDIDEKFNFKQWNQELFCININSQSAVFPKNSIYVSFETKAINLVLPRFKKSPRTKLVLLSETDVEHVLVYCDIYSFCFISIITSSNLGESLKEDLKTYKKSSPYFDPDAEHRKQLQISFLLQNVTNDISGYLSDIYGHEKVTKITHESAIEMLSSTLPTKCQGSLLKA